MSDQLEPELERVARMLADAGPLPDAPASLRERALAIPDGGTEERAGVIPIARRARRRPRLPVLVGIAAAAAAIVIVPTVVVLHGDNGPERVALDPRPFAPKGAGTASVARHGDGSATIAMRVWGLPRQTAGHTYEAWLGRKGDRRALGTFSAQGRRHRQRQLHGLAPRARGLPLALGDERARRAAAPSRATRPLSGALSPEGGRRSVP